MITCILLLRSQLDITLSWIPNSSWKEKTDKHQIIVLKPLRTGLLFKTYKDNKHGKQRKLAILNRKWILTNPVFSH